MDDQKISQLLMQHEHEIEALRKKQLEIITQRIHEEFKQLLGKYKHGTTLTLQVSLTHEFDGFITVDCEVINSDLSALTYGHTLRRAAGFLQDYSFVFAGVKGIAVTAITHSSIQPLEFKSNP